jgi:hypothetical protein
LGLIRRVLVAALFGWSLTTPNSLSAADLWGQEPAHASPAGIAYGNASTWYVQSEALWLTRTRTDWIPFTAIDTTGMGDMQIVQSSDYLDFGYKAGIRLTLGRRLDACNSLEFSYFGLQDFDGSSTVLDPSGGLYSPYSRFQTGLFGYTFGFDQATEHQIEYESSLHNAEFNFRHCGPVVGSLESDLLFGVRYLNIKERFGFLSTQPGGGMDGVDAFGTATNQTSNNLIGLQIGGQIRYNATERFGLTARGKAGLLVNFASHDGTFTQDMGPVVHSDYSARGEALAGLIEVGLSGHYRIGSHLTLRAGYDVILLSGLALAPEQFDVYSGYFGSSLNDRGTVVYHGPSAGLELQW